MKMTIEEIETAAVEFEMVDWEEQSVISERSREVIASSLESMIALKDFIDKYEKNNGGVE